MNASVALEKLLRDYEFQTVLDVGCGVGEPHRQAFEDAGKVWSGYEISLERSCVGAPHRLPFDCLWMSHVLEHMEDVDYELYYWLKRLRCGGVLAITVPPLKHQIVGGHVNLFNAGLLLYRLALLGIDCSEAAVKSEGYDISVIVDRVHLKPVRGLKHDRGDIEKLAHLLPPMCREQGFDGRISEYNW